MNWTEQEVSFDVYEDQMIVEVCASKTANVFGNEGDELGV